MLFTFYIIGFGVFIQGLSEFMIAGIGPAISQSLGIPISETGSLTSSFAIGMVFGAPLIAILVRRFPRKRSLLGFLLVFALCHTIAAGTHSFIIILITRIISAFVNAGFLAIALLIAAEESLRNKKAIPLIMSGATLACALGAPVSALLDAFFGWRVVFWLISFSALIISLGLYICEIPHRTTTTRESEVQLKGRKNSSQISILSEISALKQRKVFLYMILAVLVNGATFCGFTYLLPVLRYNSRFAHANSDIILLLLFGIGAFIGVRLSNYFLECGRKTMILLGSVLLVGWLMMELNYNQHIVMVLLLLIQGMLSFLIGTIIIARILNSVISFAPSLAGAYSTLALNVGAAIGPVVGGIIIGTSTHYYLALWYCIGSAALYFLGLLVI